ncbi:hypothetical protein [Methylobacterium haplocladii]|nr:hypothetical protein [Methylobacterium haplocladii]
MTREYDGTCTVRIGRSLILSSLRRAAADQFVATYRRLTVPSLQSEPEFPEASPSIGSRQGRPSNRYRSSPRDVTATGRKRA